MFGFLGLGLIPDPKPKPFLDKTSDVNANSFLI